MTPEETPNLIPVTSKLEPPVELGCSPVVECVVFARMGPHTRKRGSLKKHTLTLSPL